MINVIIQRRICWFSLQQNEDFGNMCKYNIIVYDIHTGKHVHVVTSIKYNIIVYEKSNILVEHLLRCHLS